MEGLRLLDESQRDGGAEAVEETAASATPSTPSGPTSAGTGRKEEEEDVLLDS
jgi:hypothetical protein